MIKFKVGETYQTRSIGDWECIYSWEVLGRTARFITVVDSAAHRNKADNAKRIGVRDHEGVEYASPFGRYSMSPTISADRHLVEPCKWCSGEYQTARKSPSLVARRLHDSTTECYHWTPPSTAEVAAELVKIDDPRDLALKHYDTRPLEQITTEDLTYLLDSLEVRRALCLAQGTPTPEINSRLRASIGIELANPERNIS